MVVHATRAALWGLVVHAIRAALQGLRLQGQARPQSGLSSSVDSGMRACLKNNVILYIWLILIHRFLQRNIPRHVGK